MVYSINVFLFTAADGRATITESSTEIDTTALEFCKPVLNDRLGWCFIAKRSSKPSETAELSNYTYNRMGVESAPENKEVRRPPNKSAGSAAYREPTRITNNRLMRTRAAPAPPAHDTAYCPPVVTSKRPLYTYL
ncbi:hypothetical protein EVAR_33983_1 [Eumeta japonica]|uniref:Uncharacterized protein n=1 Tax=Eumeta variegata TaxID=151549 RepID=A0A4C1WZF7_EUMVA|nr:hypothetical protein EVAR_33983_1 [Eumeta japonica]